MIRLFVTHDLTAGADINLPGDQAHYLVNVMRLGVGKALRLFNGRDGEWAARLTAVAKRGCVLRVETLERPQQIGPDLDLLVALVKRPRLETIVEKAAELGARRVRLITTERTNADRAKIDRLTAIAVEASEQTGRLDVPEVVAPERLDRILADWDPARRLMFCDEAGDAAPALTALSSVALNLSSPSGGNTGEAGEGGQPHVGPNLPAPSPPSSRAKTRAPLPPQGEESGPNLPWAILIGPEGGFSHTERARVRAVPGAVPVSLGPRILRADTAAIAAMTLWQAAIGDWTCVTPPSSPAR